MRLRRVHWTELLDQVLDAGPDIVGAEFHDRMKKIKQQEETPLSVGAELRSLPCVRREQRHHGQIDLGGLGASRATLHEHIQDLDATDIYTLRRIVPADRGRQWDN